MGQEKRTDWVDDETRDRLGRAIRAIADCVGGSPELSRRSYVSNSSLDRYCSGRAVPKIGTLDSLAQFWRRGAQAQHLLAFVRRERKGADLSSKDLFLQEIQWRGDYELLTIAQICLTEIDRRGSLHGSTPRKVKKKRADFVDKPTRKGVGKIVREVASRGDGLAALARELGVGLSSLDDYVAGVTIPKIGTLDLIAAKWRKGSQAQDLLVFVREGRLPGEGFTPLDHLYQDQLQWRSDLVLLDLTRAIYAEIQRRGVVAGGAEPLALKGFETEDFPHQ